MEKSLSSDSSRSAFTGYAASSMFSLTVRSTKTLLSCHTYLMPSRAAFSGLTACTGLPSKKMDPREGCRNPATLFNKVVLPAPFRPTMQISSPSFTLIVTPWRTWALP